MRPVLAVPRRSPSLCARHAILALCLAACGARPLPLPRLHAPARAAVASAPPGASVGLLFLPVHGMGFAAGREEDGWTPVVYGGRRARVRDDVVAWADDRFLTPIARVVRLDNAWVFVAADGTAAASDTFLGPLRRLGEFAGAIAWEGTPSFEDCPRGRAALVDRDGAAWTSYGRAPFARVAGFEPLRVLAIAFTDALHGTATVDGGFAHVTDDGGARWRPRPPGAPDAADAAARCRADDREDRDEAPLRLLRSLVLRDPGSALVYAARSDAERRAVAREFQAYGIGGPPSTDPDDASLDVELGACDTRTGWPSNPTDAVCVTAREAPPRTVRLSAVVAEILAREGTRLLVRLERGAGVGRVDLAGDARAPAPVETVLDASEGRPGSVELMPGGFLVAVLARDDPWGLAVWRFGERPSVVALPPDARHVVFADTARGLAWGEAPGVVHRTRDGGLSWERVPLDIDGRVDDLPWGAGQRTAAACSDRGCIAADAVVVHGWGPFDAPPARILAARASAPPTTFPAWPAPEHLPRLQCAVDRAARALPQFPPVPVGRPARRVALRGVGVEAEVALWLDARRRVVGRFAWRGVDARGAWLAAGPAEPLLGRWTYGADLRPTAPTYELVHADRERLVVSVRGTNDPPFLVTPGARIATLDVRLAFGRVWARPDGLVVLDENGGRSGEVREVAWSGAPGRRRAYRFFSWAAPGRRSDEASPPRAIVLARRGDEPAVATAADAAARQLVVLPITADAPPTLAPWPADSPVAPCRAPPAPDAVTLLVDDPRSQREGRETTPAPPAPAPIALPDEAAARARLTFEAAAGGACLRRVDRLGSEHTWWVEAQPDGTLRGVVLAADGARGVRCEAP